MHEATLAAYLFHIAEDAREGRGAARVRKVNVLAGAMAGVLPGALCFAFNALKTGTPFEAAEMDIAIQPARALCGDCGAEYAPAAFPWTCPACRGSHFRLIDGEDVILESLELEE